MGITAFEDPKGRPPVEHLVIHATLNLAYKGRSPLSNTKTRDVLWMSRTTLKSIPFYYGTDGNPLTYCLVRIITTIPKLMAASGNEVLFSVLKNNFLPINNPRITC
jgi:hypothetical protein